MTDLSVVTTNGDLFSSSDHQMLANLLFRRWGRDRAAFCVAWRRLFENNAEDSEIMKLIPNPECRYPSPGGNMLTYFEADSYTCVGQSPCPSCAVSDDDRSDRHC